MHRGGVLPLWRFGICMHMQALRKRRHIVAAEGILTRDIVETAGGGWHVVIPLISKLHGKPIVKQQPLTVNAVRCAVEKGVTIDNRRGRINSASLAAYESMRTC